MMDNKGETFDVAHDWFCFGAHGCPAALVLLGGNRLPRRGLGSGPCTSEFLGRYWFWVE